MRWNGAKNESLEVSRGVTFETVVVAVEAGGLLDVVEHPDTARYPGQRILVVAVDDYVHLLPCVEEHDDLFLKTIIPSRKATRDYLVRRLGSAENDDAGRRDARPEDTEDRRDG